MAAFLIPLTLMSQAGVQVTTSLLVGPGIQVDTLVADVCLHPLSPVLRANSLLIVDWLKPMTIAMPLCVCPVSFNTATWHRAHRSTGLLFYRVR